MNTQPDQAEASEDKPRIRVCNDCDNRFLSRDGKAVCQACTWTRDQAAAVAKQRFDDDFAKIFATGRRT